MVFLGWFMVTVVGPLLLPVAGIVPFRLLPIGIPVRLMATVKDGQLCWAAVAMGASSIYELWQAVQAHGPLPPMSGPLLTLDIPIMLSAMMIAAGGSVFNTPWPAAGLDRREWISHYRVFVVSAIMTATTAAIYAYFHFHLSP